MFWFLHKVHQSTLNFWVCEGRRHIFNVFLLKNDGDIGIDSWISVAKEVVGDVGVIWGYNT